MFRCGKSIDRCEFNFWSVLRSHDQKQLLFPTVLPFFHFSVKVKHMARGFWIAALWCDLEFTFDLAVGALTFQALSGLYLGICKAKEVDT